MTVSQYAREAAGELSCLLCSECGDRDTGEVRKSVDVAAEVIERHFAAALRDHAADADRLNWLEEGKVALVSDYDGDWVAVCDSLEGIPSIGKHEVTFQLFADRRAFRPTIREAIDAARKEEEEAAEKEFK